MNVEKELSVIKEKMENSLIILNDILASEFKERIYFEDKGRDLDQLKGVVFEVDRLTRRGKERLRLIEKEEGIEESKKAMEANAEKIKVSHPGILEVPEGKYFYDLPVSHYVKLAKEKGKPEIMRALLNLERWNKEKEPKISEMTRSVIDRLKASKEWESINDFKKKNIVEQKDEEDFTPEKLQRLQSGFLY